MDIYTLKVWNDSFRASGLYIGGWVSVVANLLYSVCNHCAGVGRRWIGVIHVDSESELIHVIRCCSCFRCYQEVLERQAGDHMINPRVHHNVAETLEAMRGYSDALKHERLSYAGCAYKLMLFLV